MIGWCFFWDAEQIWRVFPGYLWMMMMILSNHNFQISHSSTTVWGLLFIHMAAAQNVSGPDPYPGRSIPLIYTLLNRYTSFEIICVFPLFHTSRSLHNDPLHNDPYTFLSHSHVFALGPSFMNMGNSMKFSTSTTSKVISHALSHNAYGFPMILPWHPYLSKQNPPGFSDPRGEGVRAASWQRHDEHTAAAEIQRPEAMGWVTIKMGISWIWLECHGNSNHEI